MSVLNLAWRIVVLVAVAAVGPSAMGQSATLGQTFHPFAEPLEFNPDWQFFAPVDVDSVLELPSRKRANNGWFATWDRTYLRMSRSDTEQSETLGDFTWGNRFDLGLMNDKESGWLVSLRSVGGPNVYDRTMQERINRVNAADVFNPSAPIFPVDDRNDPQLRQRVYVLGDSLNVAGISSVEINKTWRMEPYRYGGILEPMLGLRYTKFKDYSVDQAYARAPGPLISTNAAPGVTNIVETLQSFEANNDNYMVGGELGFRYFNYYKRWTLSTELRAFGLQNFYDTRNQTRQIITEYSAATAGATVVAQDTSSTFGIAYDHGTAFVPGFEVRAEAGYQVTKYFNIRGGLDFIDFARGVLRGSAETVNGLVIPGQPLRTFETKLQDVQLVGVTFGITLNR